MPYLTTDTICSECGHMINVGDKKPNDFVPHCGRFHVVGNAEFQRQLVTERKEQVAKTKGLRKVRVSNGPLIVADIKKGLSDKAILKKYPIKATYLQMIHYKIKKGILK